MSQTRLSAARIINQVTDGKSLSDVLEHELKSFKDARDAALVQTICFGVCRFYTTLDVILSELLKKPMKAKDGLIHALLLTGLYQLLYLRVPEHAAVSETVAATAQLKQTWARGFVNAILREFLRNKTAILNRIENDEEAKWSHPFWLIAAIKKNYPTHYEAILTANNQHPPLILRVNTQKISREDYLKKLIAHDIHASIVPETTAGILLEVPISIEKLPGFLQGEVSVQDAAAQLASEILNAQDDELILDACAAPGGKLTHILEMAPNAKVIAVEKDKHRLQSIQQNLSRLHLKAECICADANNTNAWWNGKLFDRILLDAPCSASGVIRRHPDIKLLRQPQDISALAKQQTQLLNTLWPLLKPGGTFLYATCSIFPQENSEIIRSFLQTHEDAREQKIAKPLGISTEFGLQILPGMHHMDGFYFALIQKEAPGS